MIQCEGLDQEIYDLYVLDLLESPLSQFVKAHLEGGCPACRKRTGEATNLWAAMAVSGAEASAVRPNAALKRRIVQSVDPARGRFAEWFLMPQTWTAAAIIVLISGSTVGFYGRSGNMNSIFPLSPALTQPRATLEPSIEKSAPLPTAMPPGARRPETTRPISAGEQAQIIALKVKLANLERDFSASASSAGQSALALQSERDRIQSLEAELGKQKTAVEVALQQRRQIESDYRRVQAQGLDRVQPDKAELQRVQLLQAENVRLRKDLTMLQQRAEQGLQLAGFLGSPQIRLVKLKGTEAGANATAQVLISGSGKILLFTGDLPALPAGREYQLWMIRASNPAIVSVGVFRSSDHKTEFQVADASVLNSLTSLAVTEEPAGGSAKPTGHKLLIGLARS